MAVLSDDEIAAALASLPGWVHDRDRGEIAKEFVFKRFMDAIGFINRIAERAQEAKHHPDIENHYNRVRVGLHSWDEGGITDKDVALAREIGPVAEV